jgi:hypothetical protein
VTTVAQWPGAAFRCPDSSDMVCPVKYQLMQMTLERYYHLGVFRCFLVMVLAKIRFGFWFELEGGLWIQFTDNHKVSFIRIRRSHLKTNSIPFAFTFLSRTIGVQQRILRESWHHIEEDD